MCFEAWKWTCTSYFMDEDHNHAFILGFTCIKALGKNMVENFPGKVEEKGQGDMP